MAQSRPTKKQKEVLNFIDSFIATNQYSPSYREIMDGCGYNSVATVAKHVDNLISRGHLRKTQHHARTLELVEPNLSQDKASSAKDSDTKNKEPEAVDHKTWLVEQVEAKLAGDDVALHEAQTLINAIFILGMEAESSALQDKLESIRQAQDSAE